MKAGIDRSGCIGCGLCAGTCPEIFEMAEDGLAEVICQPAQEQMENTREAAENCPVSVIIIEE